jgi:serine/threonine-protein kinase RsbT
MSDLHSGLADLLQRFVSPIIAKSILTRALRELEIAPTGLVRTNVHALAPRIEAAVKLFVEADVLQNFRTELREFVGAPTVQESTTLSIRTERDLADALSETRRLCQVWCVRAITKQKIATVVSELARNIVSYTPGGSVELIPIHKPSPRLLIRATDSGSGIPNLEEIMGGRYRSKTGLGKGLLGSKRLSDRFEVRSGRAGTVIEAELNLL